MSQSASLDILVRTRDEATAGLNRVARSGQQMGQRLSSGAARSTAAITKTTSASTRFGSSLRKVAGYVGVAFAVTEVVRWGKASVAAYEDVKKQQDLVLVGLRNIGQSSQYAATISKLKAVSAQTVTLQADTDQVGAAVLNVGHNYFQSLGPEASSTLAGLVRGILNISAATHKSLSMLQRSLTLAVINTPDKAISTLQKLGIATRGQADEWKKLAKEGDLVTLRQQEVNAVTNAYPGAAGDSATASDKLKKSLNDLKVKVGQLLSPLLNVVAKVAAFAAKNGALIGTLAGNAGLIFLVYKLSSAFTALKVAAGVTGSVGLLGAGLAGLGKVATDPALVAGLPMLAGFVADLSDKLHGAPSKSEALRSAIDGLGSSARALYGTLLKSNSLLGSSTTMRTVGAWVAQMVDGARQGQISWHQALFSINGDLKSSGSQIRLSLFDVMRLAHGQTVAALTTKGAARVVKEAMAQQREAMRSEATAARRFAGMSAQAWRKWSGSAKQSARQAIVSIGGVALATNKTARQFVRDSRAMARAAQQDARAMKQLASKSQTWVPDKYKQWLVDQGPAAVANFERLTHEKQQAVVGDWQRATGGADKYNRAINQLKTRPFDMADAAAARLNAQLDRLSGRAIYIDVYLRQHGKLPHHARGRRGGPAELAVVGESGSEIVALPEGADVYPHGQRPTAGAMVGASAASAAPSKIEVGVSLDRRRFVDQGDYDSTYRGF